MKKNVETSKGAIDKLIVEKKTLLIVNPVSLQFGTQVGWDL